MSYQTIESAVNVVAGLLQFAVAVYALRLTRVYGAMKVGWSLFCAFALLAAVHVAQFLMPSWDEAAAPVPTVEVMYAMVAMLLLMGMVHMESLLKERLRIAQQQEQMRGELEIEVKKKTAYLTRAIEELQAEIDRRTSAEAKVEQSATQLFYANQRVKAAETIDSLLHKMMAVIKSVNVSTSLVSDHMKQSKIANVVRVGNLVRDHAANLGEFMSHDPRGQKLPQYIVQLAEHLADEQVLLTGELASIKRHIEEIMAMQKDHAKISWEMKPVEDGKLAETQTATA